MKAITCLLALPLLMAAPVTGAETSLKDLQRRCAEQERQIEALERENSRLRARLNGPEDAPAETPEAGNAEASEAPSARALPSHTVKPGETLSAIAGRHDTTAAELAELNGIRNAGLIRVGQKLTLPADDTEPETTDEETVTGTHVVKTGETFYSIARTYGLSINALGKANPEVNPRKLRVGEELRLVARKTSETGEFESAPEPPEPTAEPEQPAESERTALNERRIRKVQVDQPISFSKFAANHAMDVERLNRLNALTLSPNTVLKEGSALYVSAQPLD